MQPYVPMSQCPLSAYPLQLRIALQLDDLQLCTYVHMHLCTYAPMHLYTYAPMHLCTYAPMHLCTYAPMHLCKYASMHLCTIMLLCDFTTILCDCACRRGGGSSLLDWSPPQCALTLLPTTYHLLPTTYHLPPTTYHLPPTTYHLLPTTYYLLPPHLPPLLTSWSEKNSTKKK
jgi:hypothetical protein